MIALNIFLNIFSSRIDDDIADNDDRSTRNGSLVFVNSSLNPSVHTKLPSTMIDHSVLLRPNFSDHAQPRIPQYHPSPPTNFIRLPHLLRNSNPPLRSSLPSGCASISSMNHLRSRHSMPAVETSVPSSIPEEIFNCCQT